jgi:Zn-dependent protease
MGGSVRIARIAGIDVYLHWTFIAMFIFLGYTFWSKSQSVPGMLSALAFVASVFACVVLHELGHALAARQFGVPTRDITLYPIGGVARLERIPREPLQELWIAVAGPLVNLLIAAGLFFLLGGNIDIGKRNYLDPQAFLASLLWVNLFLLGFNLIPAFPMDGGRVLRAFLAMGMSHWRATEIAASVGKSLAVVFGIVGLLVNPMLLFIALFVYLGAEGESQLSRISSLLTGVPVRDGMMTEFESLNPEQTLEFAVDRLLAGSQQDFPVLEDGRLVGILWRHKLFQGLQQGGLSHVVRQYMEPVCLTASPWDALDGVVQKMRDSGCSTVPVVWDDRLVGLVTNENVLELLQIRQILGERLRQPLQG